MNSRPWLLAGAGVAVILAALCVRQRGEVSFDTLAEAKDRFEGLGYHCTYDAADPQAGRGFLVSRQPVAPTNVGALAKVGRFDRRLWHGKAWVTHRLADLGFDDEPRESDLRRWGSILALGDREFLDELESKVVQ
jgi:hypothetical protein